MTCIRRIPQRAAVMIAIGVAFLLALPTTVHASSTSVSGRVLSINGTPTFPIMVSTGPPTVAGMRTLVSEGVDVFKYQPQLPWSDAAAIPAARLFDARVARAGGVSELNLCAACGDPAQGSIAGALLGQVSAAVAHDPGFGFYKGPDEPWLYHLSASVIRPSFLAIRRSDPAHLWTEFQGDTGTTADFLPYGQTTNIGGIAVFPIRSGGLPNRPLTEVGAKTAAILAATPSRTVWTTLQLCDAGATRGSNASGLSYTYALPTRAQYRFMMWDAIVNGARGINFFGGFMKGCWNSKDTAAGWNWNAWNRVVPTVTTLERMRGVLVGRRVHLARVGSWQRVRLTGKVHSYIAAVNIATYAVKITNLR